MTWKTSTPRFILPVLAGMILLSTNACAGNSWSAEVAGNTVVTSSNPESRCAEGFTSLSPSELERLRDLQTGIPYSVLVPACVPQGYALKPETVIKTPVSSGADSSVERSDNQLKPGYRFSISNGTFDMEFAGNIGGEPSLAFAESREIRGRNAYVYFGRRDDKSGRSAEELFESSSYYRVLWDESRDLPGRGGGVQGVYMAYAKQIKWNDLTLIINSMAPADELEADTLNQAVSTSVGGGQTGLPVISITPSTGACIGGPISFTGSGMPEGQLTLRMIFTGASGWNDAPLGVADADATGNWSLTTTVPTENTNHWKDKVTLEPMYSGFGDFDWRVEAVGSDGVSMSNAILTVLNCQVDT